MKISEQSEEILLHRLLILPNNSSAADGEKILSAQLLSEDGSCFALGFDKVLIDRDLRGKIPDAEGLALRQSEALAGVG